MILDNICMNFVSFYTVNILKVGTFPYFVPLKSSILWGEPG